MDNLDNAQQTPTPEDQNKNTGEDVNTDVNTDVNVEDKDKDKTFTEQEILNYINKVMDKQKKENEERKKQEEEDKKLTEKQRQERDFKSAKMQLELDKLTFGINVYRNSLNLQEDKNLDAILSPEMFINKDNCLESAKDFINAYKLAVDTAFNKGKETAEKEFNKLKMEGQEIFNGVNTKVSVEEKVDDFDSFYNSLNK